jgi:cytolysin-activating lysine-acyltransferase
LRGGKVGFGKGRKEQQMPDPEKDPRGAKRMNKPGANGASAGHPQAEPAPKTVTQVLGEIAWLMDQSPRHSEMPVDDLEWLLAPPVMYGQFRMFYNGDVPTGVVLWAQVDDVVAERIDAGIRRLTTAEWQSGSNLRIIEVVAPFGGEAEMRELVTRLASE